MGLDTVFVHSGFRRQVAAGKVIAKEILLIRSELISLDVLLTTKRVLAHERHCLCNFIYEVTAVHNVADRDYDLH